MKKNKRIQCYRNTLDAGLEFMRNNERLLALDSFRYLRGELDDKGTLGLSEEYLGKLTQLKQALFPRKSLDSQLPSQ